MQEVLNVEFETEIKRRIFDRKLNYVIHLKWDTETKIAALKVPEKWTLLSLSLDDPEFGSKAWIEVDGDTILELKKGPWFKTIGISIYSKPGLDHKSIEEELKKQFPVMELKPKPKENKVYINFWALGPMGPENFYREQSVLPWDDIKDNYTTSVRQELTEFITRAKSLNLDSESGKLILWTGAAGTGKTWAIRALASETANELTFNYIVDPEVFLQGSSAYMHRVLLKEGSSSSGWRVIILEDCGEFLSKDAKSKAGQGFSRLLNACDGLLGQGLKFILLITSNEDIENFHEAIRRPGRCISDIKFNDLSKEEIMGWCKIHKITSTPPYPASLAQLYAMTRHETTGKQNKAKIGFVPQKEPTTFEDYSPDLNEE